MAATVKSLDERVDDVVGDLAGVKGQLVAAVHRLDFVSAQLAGLTSGQATAQAQAAATAARLDAAIEAQQATNARLGEVAGEFGALAADHSSAKARAETTFGLIRWVGATAVAALLLVLGAALNTARIAGNVEGRVGEVQKQQDRHQALLEQQQNTLGRLQVLAEQQQKTLDAQQKTLDAQQKTLDRLEKSVDRLEKSVDEIKRDVADIRVKVK